MKTKNYLGIVLLVLFFSGCVVYSFYPLYTEDDLFANDLLLGEWIENDSTVWQFEHHLKGKKNNREIDSTAFVLRIKEKDEDSFSHSSLLVRVVKLEENYFLDFFLDEYFEDEPSLFDFHVVPVHTFAKTAIASDSIHIQWFDPEWMETLIKENRIRIHHENNGDNILLTARPLELQKFVKKYVNSEEAFKDGLDVKLRKNKK